MFNRAIRGQATPKYLSAEHDPLYLFHRWQANLRILDITEVKTFPYVPQANRLYGVMNKRLGEVAYLAGDSYTIADIATYPWIARYERQQVDLGHFPEVKRWFDELSVRPAVDKGMGVAFRN